MLTEDQKARLAEAVPKARKVAEAAGPMHGVWDSIQMAEAYLAGNFGWRFINETMDDTVDFLVAHMNKVYDEQKDIQWSRPI